VLVVRSSLPLFRLLKTPRQGTIDVIVAQMVLWMGADIQNEVLRATYHTFQFWVRASRATQGWCIPEPQHPSENLA
jgi:hypothetical protein